MESGERPASSQEIDAFWNTRPPRQAEPINAKRLMRLMEEMWVRIERNGRSEMRNYGRMARPK